VTNCFKIISEVLDEQQMMQTAAKRLFDHVIQDELIKIITACFTVALEEEERKTIESYMPMMSKYKKNPG
jgi:anthranilate phosphoribosyltransferase